ncbi:MAG: hypothetical protein SFY70_05050 [Bacteroidia bacterium]|nr:hypothetical protein [Bacteroidia bacterium]
MERETSPADDLSHIRQVLDRHTRFLSLSGLSGVVAGVVALVAAALAYRYLQANGLLLPGTPGRIAADLGAAPRHTWVLGGLALATLVLALGGAYYFTHRLARRRGQSPTWNRTSRRMASALFLPIGLGIGYTSILVAQGLAHLVAPSALVFYGLGLYSASRYTLHEVRYLGVLQCLLGLAGMAYPGTGLLLWALGFGLLHIGYGALMYFRYERPGA